MPHQKLILPRLLILLAATLLAGCAGLEVFPVAARPGDTVTLAAGWKQDFSKSSLTVTITDSSSGAQTVIPPDDDAIQAVFNLYPDPASYLMVGTHSDIGLDFRDGNIYGRIVNNSFTGWDPDWWQTLVVFDLPAGLAEGPHTVMLSDAGGESFGPIPVEVLAGTGQPLQFLTDGGQISQLQLASLERAPHYTVTFSGVAELPAAIELELVHDNAYTHVVNPRPETKNIHWSNDFTKTKVILMTNSPGLTSSPYKQAYGLDNFKFYVATTFLGGVPGLTAQNVRAFNDNGDEILGIVAQID